MFSFYPFLWLLQKLLSTKCSKTSAPESCDNIWTQFIVLCLLHKIHREWEKIGYKEEWEMESNSARNINGVHASEVSLRFQVISLVTSSQRFGRQLNTVISMPRPQGGDSWALVQLPSRTRNSISFQTCDSWLRVDEIMQEIIRSTF